MENTPTKACPASVALHLRPAQKRMGHAHPNPILDHFLSFFSFVVPLCFAYGTSSANLANTINFWKKKDMIGRI